MTAITILGAVSIAIASATIYLIFQNKKIRNEIKPFFFINGWFVRKRIEKKNSNYKIIEPGDIVCDGFTDNKAFSGEYLGDLTGKGLYDLQNYNNPNEYNLN